MNYEYMPQWAKLEIQQMEDDLADGLMSLHTFNQAMDQLEDELYGYESEL